MYSSKDLAMLLEAVLSREGRIPSLPSGEICCSSARSTRQVQKCSDGLNSNPRLGAEKMCCFSAK